MNGKGDKSRVRDVEAYRKNFDEIQWHGNVTGKAFCDHLVKRSKIFSLDDPIPKIENPPGWKPEPSCIDHIEPRDDPWRPMRHWGWGRIK